MYIGEAGHLKDLHHRLAHMGEHHFALTVHQLLRGQQHAQSRRGDVLDLPEVQTQLGDAVKVGLQLRFQLGGGGGVDTALDGQ